MEENRKDLYSAEQIAETMKFNKKRGIIAAVGIVLAVIFMVQKLFNGFPLGLVCAVAENYPALKSSQLFANLQNVVMDTEDTLQASRRIYNSNVTYYNKMVVSFPSSIVSGMKKYTKKELYKATESKRGGFEILM